MATPTSAAGKDRADLPANCEGLACRRHARALSEGPAAAPLMMPVEGALRGGPFQVLEQGLHGPGRQPEDAGDRAPPQHTQHTHTNTQTHNDGFRASDGHQFAAASSSLSTRPAGMGLVPAALLATAAHHGGDLRRPGLGPRASTAAGRAAAALPPRSRCGPPGTPNQHTSLGVLCELVC